MLNLLRILDFRTPTMALQEELVRIEAAEWEALYGVAQRQGVALLVYERLKPLRGLATPEALEAALAEAYLRATARNMMMLHHTGAALKALRAAGLEVIGLKGVHLAENVYPKIGLRTFGDVDILVKRRDLAAGMACLQGLGYGVSTYFDAKDTDRDTKHAPPMTKPDGPMIEVHWSIVPDDSPFAVDVEGLWQRAAPTRIAGVEALALGVEDLVLYLGIHVVYQHRLEMGLKGLYDIGAVLQRYAEQIDWERLVSLAQAWGVERVTALTLRLVEETLGIGAPAEVGGRLAPEGIAPDVLARAHTLLWARQESALRMTSYFAKWATAKGMGERLAYGWRRVFVSRRILARLYGCPPTSLRIYGFYVLRLRDLVRRYGEAALGVARNEERMAQAVGLAEEAIRLRDWLAGANR